MGILDDTIREHLELKRKHGARDAELKQLEDEAFGPPSRPGEPDFPERPPTGEEEAVEPLDETSPAEATRVLSPDAQSEPAVTAPPEGSEEEAAIGPEAPEERSAPAFFDQSETEEEPAFGAVEPEATEHAIPEPGGPDTVEHPAPEPSAAEASEEDELEVEGIELELSEEFEEFREVEDTSGPAPIAGETDEHGAIVVDDDDEDEEGFTDEREVVLDDEDETHAEHDDEEDVLEETPEFLRDTPEHERLWFEQGEPRDFDFDDD